MMSNQSLGCKKTERHVLPREVTSILDFLNNARNHPDQVQIIDAFAESEIGPRPPCAWLFVNCSLTNLFSRVTWHHILAQIDRNAHVVLYTLHPHTAYGGGEYNILSLYPLAFIPEGHITFVRVVPAPEQTLAVVQAGLYQMLPVVSTHYSCLYHERSAYHGPNGATGEKHSDRLAN